MNKRKFIKKRSFFALLIATLILVISIFILLKAQRGETVELGKMTVNVPYTFNGSAETIIDSWDISASNSDNVSAVLYGDGKLVISGTGKMKSWNFLNNLRADWFEQKDNILTIEIQNGVKNIGSSAFYKCTNVSTIQLPNSVENIESYSFHVCSNLNNINIPNSVISIDNLAFCDCTNLTNIIIPNSVTTIGNQAFYNCNKLSSISISEGVTSIGEECFKGCTGLTNMVIPSTVETVNKKAFENCNNLSSIEIKNGVKNIGTQCFKGCTNLSNIEIPSSVTNIDSQEYSEFSSISVDSNNTTYSSSNGVLFDKNKTTIICYPGGKNDKTYNIPSSVTTIKKYSFSGCRNIEHVKIPSSVRTIEEDAFSGASITSIEIENGVITIGTRAFRSCDNLITIEIPNSVTSIDGGAFGYCDNLTSVTLSKGIDTLEIGMFYNCKSLKSIIIPGNIKTICSSAFGNCTSLETVEIQEGVTTLNAINHFRGCSKLKDISLPSTLTSLGSYTFVDCTSLTNILIPSNIDTIGEETFENCTSLKTVVIPSNVKTVKFRAFRNCSNLETVEIQEGVENIEGQVFDDCTKLSNVKIPSTVKELLYGVFDDCTNLGNVYILNNDIKMDYLNYITNYTIYCKSNSSAEAFASEHSIPYVVDDDGPTINYNPNGNSQLAKEQTTIVNVVDDKSGIQDNSLKYIWSQTTQAPVLNDFQDNFSNNDSFTKNGVDGDWYLWILAYDMMENYTIESSNKFVIDNTKPTVTVTTDKEQYYEGETATITATFNEDIKDGTPKISINGFSTLASTEMTKNHSKIYTYNYVVPKGNGTQTITISDACDLAGNVMDDNKTKKINVESIVLSNISVTTAPEKIAYIEGENFDSTGMKVTATYSNNFTKEITNYTIIGGDNLTSDTTSITISYTEDEITRTTSQPITVAKKTLTNIEITAPPTKTTYIEGQNFDPTGMKITAKYSDNSSKEVTNYTITEGNNLTIDKTSVTINYTENNITKTQEQPITVNQKTLDDIRISKAPSKTTYIEGQNFDASGMKVIAIYNNESEKEITNYTIIDGNNLTIDKTNVTISYTENNITKTTTQSIIVSENILNNIVITSEPNKTEYIEGQNFDTAGMKITANYSDGSSKEITNYIIIDGNNLTVNKTTITVSYTENNVTKTVDQTITVSKKTLSSIRISTAPNKTTYIEGQNFDATGMKVTAIYNNSTNKEVTDYTITGASNLTTDKTSVTISYTESGVTKTTTQPITVTKKLEISFDGYNEVNKDGIKYIDNIAPSTTMENLINNVGTNGTITVYKDNKEITDKKIKISTGMKVKISLNNENHEFTIVVKGDTNGDGESDLRDLLQINKHRLNKTLLTAEHLLAGDVNKDNEVNLKDLLQINKFRLGKINTL